MRSGPFVAFTVALLLPFAAGAQSLGGLGDMSQDAFSLSVSPDYPAPYSQIVISLSSNTLTLANVTLTVSVDGKQTYSGTARAFSINLGAAGTATTVRATLKVGGASYSQTLSIVPQDVVLIAEPVSSAPPLYPGKPSVPLGGNVRLVAIASLKGGKGSAPNPATYSYVWTVDGIQLIDSSGIGKSSVIVPAPLQYRSSDISVKVTNPNTGLTSGTSLSLSALDPIVRIYENDPLLGIRYEHALTNSYTIDGAEATLYAAPFSLPITSGAPIVQWFLNGASVQTGNSVTLRPAGNGKGNASLSLTASSEGASSASANLSLIFGLPQSNNFFGL